MAKTWYSLYVHTDKYSVVDLEKVLNVTSISSDFFHHQLIDNPLENEYPLSSLVELIEENRKLIELEEGGQVEISILYEYDDQCGFEFEPDLLLRLGRSNILLTINAYQYDEDQDNWDVKIIE